MKGEAMRGEARRGEASASDERRGEASDGAMKGEARCERRER